MLGAVALAGVPSAQQGTAQTPANERPAPKSIMANPYQMVPNWPRLGKIQPGAAIGIVPDGKGGVWLHHRSEPPILHLDASGAVVKSFGDGMFAQAHGFCQDRDGNFWAGDSGPFGDNPSAAAKSFVFHKFTPDGKLLMTIGKGGVSQAGPDTFVMPTACISMPNGNIMIADGHIPRPSYAQPDGDRLVEITREGTFVKSYGKQGTNPGEFWGPHALAYDSQGRLFVADRSNNRIQVFDSNMNFLDDWRHFGRPSGVWILEDDTMYVADSESSYPGFRPSELGPAPAAGALPRNAGWQNGVRVGSAKDGSLRYFITGTRPEGMAADEMGNVFAGLTGGCTPASGINCLQKWIRK
jgi:sugar lactone lactonase YvrE